ncbi:hypothetical protein BJ875DRAFT_543514 [Amylocarpus encephaloides]|uniref:DUF7580 domain-containing protein n=1 Tax=Amylocarpus encephaloides TaxID=45428 RepID=A0A9P7YH11_9HELO|nr:hypothetical protein BJ875DRAFT_543514 [Amylocarpus encephaloides]
MSGIEVAGLVLGSFPLLKRFRTDFLGFIDAVDIEKQLFDQTIERFLISADVPHEELGLFMNDPDYTGWHDNALVVFLQTRLGPSYPVYMSTIRAMNDTMKDLETVLSLTNGQFDWATEGANRWDYQLKRIQLSFSKRGTKKVASLESNNRKLRDLLNSNEWLDKKRIRHKGASWANVFECIRRHARSVHTAITKGWNCSCTIPHIAALRLEQRSKGGWGSHFVMVFNIVEGQVKINDVPKEVVITVQVDATDAVNSQRNLVLLPDRSQGNIDQLRSDFTLTEKSMLGSLPRSLLRPSDSESTSTSSLGRVKTMFSRKNSSNNCTTISTSNGTELLVSGSTTDLHREIAKSTPRNSIEIRDLCSALWQSDTNSTCCGYITDDQDRKHEILEINEEALAATGCLLVTLEDLLNGKAGLRLNRRQRHQIASILASSLLQLQTTPWLAGKIAKSSVFFLKRGTSIAIDHPYIQHSFVSTKLGEVSPNMPEQGNTRFAARNSLAYLGILLLEPCFGETIESQKIRNSYLGPDGKEYESADPMTLSPADYMTARDWVERVYEEEPDLEHIIRCCVFCAFEERADWSSPKFVQVVYESVVEPLEQIIAKWPST